MNNPGSRGNYGSNMGVPYDQNPNQQMLQPQFLLQQQQIQQQQQLQQQLLLQQQREQQQIILQQQQQQQQHQLQHQREQQQRMLQEQQQKMLQEQLNQQRIMEEQFQQQQQMWLQEGHQQLQRTMEEMIRAVGSSSVNPSRTMNIPGLSQQQVSQFVDSFQRNLQMQILQQQQLQANSSSGNLPQLQASSNMKPQNLVPQQNENSSFVPQQSGNVNMRTADAVSKGLQIQDGSQQNQGVVGNQSSIFQKSLIDQSSLMSSQAYKTNPASTSGVSVQQTVSSSTSLHPIYNQSVKQQSSASLQASCLVPQNRTQQLVSGRTSPMLTSQQQFPVLGVSSSFSLAQPFFSQSFSLNKKPADNQVSNLSVSSNVNSGISTALKEPQKLKSILKNPQSAVSDQRANDTQHKPSTASSSSSSSCKGDLYPDLDQSNKTVLPSSSTGGNVFYNPKQTLQSQSVTKNMEKTPVGSSNQQTSSLNINSTKTTEESSKKTTVKSKAFLETRQEIWSELNKNLPQSENSNSSSVKSANYSKNTEPSVNLNLTTNQTQGKNPSASKNQGNSNMNLKSTNEIQFALSSQSEQSAKVTGGQTIPTLVGRKRDQPIKRKAVSEVPDDVKKSKMSTTVQAAAFNPTEHDLDDEDPEHVQAQVFITNMPADTTKNRILELLTHYNFTSPEVWIGRHNTNKDKVCAFVKLPSLKDSKRVISEMSGFPYKGMEMQLRFTAAADFMDYSVSKDVCSKNQPHSKPDVKVPATAPVVSVPVDTSVPPPVNTGSLPHESVHHSAVHTSVIHTPVLSGSAPAAIAAVEFVPLAIGEALLRYPPVVSVYPGMVPSGREDQGFSPGQRSRDRYSEGSYRKNYGRSVSPGHRDYSPRRDRHPSPYRSGGYSPLDGHSSASRLSSRRYSRSPEYVSHGRQMSRSRSRSLSPYGSRRVSDQFQSAGLFDEYDARRYAANLDLPVDEYDARLYAADYQFPPAGHMSRSSLSPVSQGHQRSFSPRNDYGSPPRSFVSRSSLSPVRSQGHQRSLSPRRQDNCSPLRGHRSRSSLSPVGQDHGRSSSLRQGDRRCPSDGYCVHVGNLPSDIQQHEVEALLKEYLYDGVRFQVRDRRATADIYVSNFTETKMMTTKLHGCQYLGATLQAEWTRVKPEPEMKRRSADRELSKRSKERVRSPPSTRGSEQSRISQDRVKSPPSTRGSEQSLFQSLLDASYPNAPVLGRKYIKEFTKKGSSKAYYLCVLCEVTLTWKDIADHMVGYKHRLRSIKRSHPRIYDRIDEIENKVDMLGQCAKYAIELEDRLEKITIVETDTPEKTAKMHLDRIKDRRRTTKDKSPANRQDRKPTMKEKSSTDKQDSKTTTKDRSSTKKSESKSKDSKKSSASDSTSDIFKKIEAFKKKFEATKDTPEKVDSEEIPAKRPRRGQTEASHALSFEELSEKNKPLADTIAKELESARKESEANASGTIEDKDNADAERKVENLKKRIELARQKVDEDRKKLLDAKRKAEQLAKEAAKDREANKEELNTKNEDIKRNKETVDKTRQQTSSEEKIGHEPIADKTELKMSDNTATDANKEQNRISETIKQNTSVDKGGHKLGDKTEQNKSDDKSAPCKPADKSEQSKSDDKTGQNKYSDKPEVKTSDDKIMPKIVEMNKETTVSAGNTHANQSDIQANKNFKSFNDNLPEKAENSKVGDNKETKDDVIINIDEIQELGKSITQELFEEGLGDMEDEAEVDEQSATQKEQVKMSNHPDSILPKCFHIQFLKDPENTGIVGLHYLTEVIPLKGKKAHTFVCNLCDVRCAQSSVVDHILGYKHRMKYFEVHHVEIYAKIISMNYSRKVLNMECVKHAKLVQQKDGIKPVMSLTEAEFKEKEKLSDKQTLQQKETTACEASPKPENIIQVDQPSAATPVSKPETVAAQVTSEPQETKTTEKINEVKEVAVDLKTKKGGTPDLAKRIREAKAAAKPISWFEGRESVELYRFMQQKPDVPKLGLSYITEMQGFHVTSAGSKTSLYCCDLCLPNTKIDGCHAIYEHLIGIKHVENYLKKYYPHKMIHLKLIQQRSAKTAYLNNQAKLLCQGQLKMPESIRYVNMEKLDEDKKAHEAMQAAAQALEEAKKAEVDTITDMVAAIKDGDLQTEKGVTDTTNTSVANVTSAQLTAVFYRNTAGLKDIPLVGLSYMIEIQGNSEDEMPPLYECRLCNDDHIKANYVNLHITGVSHRLNFLKVNYPVFYSKAEKDKTLTEKFCREIEELFGRESLSVKKQLSVDPDGNVVYSDPVMVKDLPTNDKDKEKPQTSESVDKTVEIEVDDQPKADILFYKLIQGLDCTPMLGLQYIKEIRHPMLMSEAVYECYVCGIKDSYQLTSRNILKHVVSKEHRLNFMKENHSHIYQEIQCLWTEEQRKFATDKHTKEIESKVGRGTITKVISDNPKYWGHLKDKLSAELPTQKTEGVIPVDNSQKKEGVKAGDKPQKMETRAAGDKQIDDEDQPQYKCQKCGVVIARCRQREHFIMAHTQCYKCKKCDISFPKHSLLELHNGHEHGILEPVPNKNEKIQINLNRWFKWYSAKGHLTKDDPSGKLHMMCKKCHSIVKYDMARKHFTAFHITQSYRCRVCNVSMNSNIALQNHLKQRHHASEKVAEIEGVTNLKLSPNFDEVWSTKEGVISDLTKNDTTKPRIDIQKLTCVQCKEVVSSETFAQSHYYKRHHSEYPCTACQAKYFSARLLAKHYHVKHQLTVDLKTPTIIFEKCFDVIGSDGKRMSYGDYLASKVISDQPGQAVMASSTKASMDSVNVTSESVESASADKTEGLSQSSGAGEPSPDPAGAGLLEGSGPSPNPAGVGLLEGAGPFMLGNLDLTETLSQKDDPDFVWERDIGTIEDLIKFGGIIDSARKAKFIMSYTSTFCTYPIVGSASIKEFQQRDILQEAWYLCQLCKEHCNARTITNHVYSLKHRIRYIALHYPDQYKNLQEKNYDSMSVLQLYIEQLCKELVKKEGTAPNFKVLIELPISEREKKAIAVAAQMKGKEESSTQASSNIASSLSSALTSIQGVMCKTTTPPENKTTGEDTVIPKKLPAWEKIPVKTEKTKTISSTAAKAIDASSAMQEEPKTEKCRKETNQSNSKDPASSSRQSRSQRDDRDRRRSPERRSGQLHTDRHSSYRKWSRSRSVSRSYRSTSRSRKHKKRRSRSRERDSKDKQRKSSQGNHSREDTKDSVKSSIRLTGKMNSKCTSEIFIDLTTEEDQPSAVSELPEMANVEMKDKVLETVQENTEQKTTEKAIEHETNLIKDHDNNIVYKEDMTENEAPEEEVEINADEFSLEELELISDSIKEYMKEEGVIEKDVEETVDHAADTVISKTEPKHAQNVLQDNNVFDEDSKSFKSPLGKKERKEEKVSENSLVVSIDLNSNNEKKKLPEENHSYIEFHHDSNESLEITDEVGSPDELVINIVPNFNQAKQNDKECTRNDSCSVRVNVNKSAIFDKKQNIKKEKENAVEDNKKTKAESITVTQITTLKADVTEKGHSTAVLNISGQIHDQHNIISKEITAETSAVSEEKDKLENYSKPLEKLPGPILPVDVPDVIKTRPETVAEAVVVLLEQQIKHVVEKNKDQLVITAELGEVTEDILSTVFEPNKQMIGTKTTEKAASNYEEKDKAGYSRGGQKHTETKGKDSEAKELKFTPGEIEMTGSSQTGADKLIRPCVDVNEKLMMPDSVGETQCVDSTDKPNILFECSTTLTVGVSSEPQLNEAYDDSGDTEIILGDEFVTIDDSASPPAESSVMELSSVGFEVEKKQTEISIAEEWTQVKQTVTANSESLEASSFAIESLEKPSSQSKKTSAASVVSTKLALKQTKDSEKLVEKSEIDKSSTEGSTEIKAVSEETHKFVSPPYFTVEDEEDDIEEIFLSGDYVTIDEHNNDEEENTKQQASNNMPATDTIRPGEENKQVQIDVSVAGDDENKQDQTDVSVTDGHKDKQDETNVSAACGDDEEEEMEEDFDVDDFVTVDEVDSSGLTDSVSNGQGVKQGDHSSPSSLMQKPNSKSDDAKQSIEKQKKEKGNSADKSENQKSTGSSSDVRSRNHGRLRESSSSRSDTKIYDSKKTSTEKKTRSSNSQSGDRKSDSPGSCKSLAAADSSKGERHKSPSRQSLTSAPNSASLQTCNIKSRTIDTCSFLGIKVKPSPEKQGHLVNAVLDKSAVGIKASPGNDSQSVGPNVRHSDGKISMDKQATGRTGANVSDNKHSESKQITSTLAEERTTYNVSRSSSATYSSPHRKQHSSSKTEDSIPTRADKRREIDSRRNRQIQESNSSRVCISGENKQSKTEKGKEDKGGNGKDNGGNEKDKKPVRDKGINVEEKSGTSKEKEKGNIDSGKGGNEKEKGSGNSGKGGDEKNKGGYDGSGSGNDDKGGNDKAKGGHEDKGGNEIDKGDNRKGRRGNENWSNPVRQIETRDGVGNSMKGSSKNSKGKDKKSNECEISIELG